MLLKVLVAAVAAGLLAQPLPSRAAGAVLPPVQAFMRTPAFAQPRMSPDGARIAALAEGAQGRRVLVVIEPADLKKSRVVAAFSDADVGHFEWVNNGRLVYTAADSDRGGADQYPPGLYAVDADGSDLRQLVDRQFRGVVTGGRGAQDRALPFTTWLLAPTRTRATDDVYVVHYPIDVRSWRPGAEWPDPVLMRLDTRTGRATPAARGTPPGQGTWLIDANDEPRVAVRQRDGVIRVYQRIGDGTEWQELLQFPAIGGEGFRPHLIRPDGKYLVTARRGRDTEALYVYDPATRQFEAEPLVSVAGFDHTGGVITGGKAGEQFLGVRVDADAPATVWVAPRYRRLQELIDARLTGRVNLLTVAEAPDARYAMVESFSDRVPPTYFIAAVDSGELTQIARAYPDIEPDRMGRVRFERIAARDGLSIPTYITSPAGAGNQPLPTVVVVHGGPWVRGGRYGWRPDAQFLASRGYRVLAPDFRGSLGYGFRHFQAGWKQWGGTMQDDLLDVVQWAVKQQLTDPQRVCVLGASYGGYAALMALARDGDTFRCGASYAGVTDIGLMFTANWTDMTDSVRRYSLRPLVGDPVADADALKAASPLHNAARIQRPLLLAHGTHDLRVPLEHGRRFREALARTNPAVEWAEYGDEGHSLGRMDNRVDFWQRVEAFLARQLGAAAN